MPSRSAQKAALRRAKEPTVIAPDGIPLPAVSSPLGWRNPMRGYDFVRDEWELFATHPGGSELLATVRKLEGESWVVNLVVAGAAGVHHFTNGAEAFALASDYAGLVGPSR